MKGEGGKKGRKKRNKEGRELQVGNTQQCRGFCHHFPSLPCLDVDLGIGFCGFGSLDWILGLRDSGEASQELPQCELVILKGV